MSLLFIDGFDHYATADINTIYSITSGSPVISASAGRRGGGAILIPSNSSSGSQVTIAITAGDVFIFGFAMKIDVYPGGNKSFFNLNDAGSGQIGFGLNSTGNLLAYRGGTIIGTSTYILPQNTWTYIEFKTTIHNSTGAYEIRANGINVLSASGIDTQATANASANSISLGATGTLLINLTLSLDDFYICDDAGSTNNTFLGDCRVDTLLPNADGNYSQFTPSTGTTHYVLVDEATPNTTDYNSSATAAQKDSYGLANLATLSSQTIFGVMATAYAAKTDAGARSIKVGMRSGTTDTVSAGQGLSTGYLYFHNIHETDPNTAAAWTESGVNSAELLVENV